MWTIYDAETLQPIADFDGVLKVEGVNDSQITKYTTERGGFTSVNKVNMPDDVSVTLMKGGSDEERAATFQALKRYETGTRLVHIITPAFTYLSMNLVRFRHSHSHREGAGMLIADLSFEEVRQTAPKYTNLSVASPDYASNEDAGKTTARPYDGWLYRQVNNGS